MPKVTFSNARLICSLLAASLCGCSTIASSAQPPVPSFRPQAEIPQPALDGPAYRILHKFGGSGDGWFPASALINVKGTLYGTTARGGSNNAGTVYSITKSGEETVLHSFGAPGDGAQPYAPLVYVNGSLYGTTSAGGTNNVGVVFSITPAGVEKVLHTFGPLQGPDGAVPYAGLINVRGTLYGTTSQGGLYEECPGRLTCGTVFSITTSGVEAVVYSFGHRVNDGFAPVAALLNDHGTLYGTTSEGGNFGRGTIFEITYGSFTSLYSFGANRFFDGTAPSSALIDVNGSLYGTTTNGGAYSDGGTVFNITKGGRREKVIHSFNGADGGWPTAGLIDVQGILYGATSQGGMKNVGTIFSMTTSGKEKVLLSFGNGSGKHPVASLFELGGTLYGTTYGVTSHRSGNVFALTP